MRSWLLIFFCWFRSWLITLFVFVIYLFFHPSNYPPFWLFIFIYLSTQLSIFLATYLSLNFLFYEYSVDLYGDLRRIRRKWGERWVRGVVLWYCEVWYVVCCGMGECGMSCAVVWWSAVLCCVSSVVLCAVCYCDVLRYVVLYERRICVHSLKVH